MGHIVSDPARRWPGGCIIWRFDPGLTEAESTVLLNAMDRWSAAANVRFLERTVQDSFVTLRADSHVDGVSHSSWVGMKGGEQFLDLEPITPSRSRASTARHELGHVIGLKHEHMRCDRDTFVKVSDRIKSDRTGDFLKLCGTDVKKVGPYDFSSIMHYGAATNATTDGTAALTGATDARQEQFDDASRSSISDGDVASVDELHGANAHVYQLTSNGQIERTVQQVETLNGVTTATPFQMDVRNFLFRIKRSNGQMRINAIDSNGAIGDLVQSRNWSGGWTHAIKYAIGWTNYFMLYKAGTGDVHIHNLNTDGSIGKKVSDTQMEGGWTAVQHYTIGLDNFLFLYNSGTGDWRIRRIEWDGIIGTGIQDGSWTTGWTSLVPYSVGGTTFLFRLKRGSGRMEIKRFRSDGTLPASETASQSWASGWTTAIPYEVQGSSYVLLLNGSTGRMHVRRLRSDGTVGAHTDRREFGPGWTVGAVYHVGFGTYLLLIKTG